MARAQGRKKMTRKEAGRKGGRAVVQKYGRGHMSEIGRKTKRRREE